MNWRFQIFDSVKLTEEISLTDGGVAPIGTSGTIVEVFQNGEAYMVELFGDWVKYDSRVNFVLASPEQEGARGKGRGRGRGSIALSPYQIDLFI